MKGIFPSLRVGRIRLHEDGSSLSESDEHVAGDECWENTTVASRRGERNKCLPPSKTVETKLERCSIRTACPLFSLSFSQNNILVAPL